MEEQEMHKYVLSVYSVGMKLSVHAVLHAFYNPTRTIKSISAIFYILFLSCCSVLFDEKRKSFCWKEINEKQNRSFFSIFQFVLQPFLLSSCACVSVLQTYVCTGRADKWEEKVFIVEISFIVLSAYWRVRKSNAEFVIDWYFPSPVPLHHLDYPTYSSYSSFPNEHNWQCSVVEVRCDKVS